uniref:Uncharacterized protein n=1 Tax=Amphimedon queenslandica TaxID=400682 RepID=A0A1X7UWR6_AMPQE
HVQDRVHALLEQRKRPHPLPPLRYLHNNRRTGGKEVDFIDSVLLSEMRQEEPSWINYRLEEDKIKKRTADEILEFLIDETVELQCLTRIQSNMLRPPYTRQHVASNICGHFDLQHVAYKIKVTTNVA